MRVVRYLPVWLGAAVCTISMSIGWAQDVAAPNNSEPAAETLNIPQKDFYIYLDNSATIVNQKDDRASTKLAEMLRQALSDEGGLLQDGDTISIFNFGASMTTAVANVSKSGSWEPAIAQFQEPREGDIFTRLTDVFASIRDIANPANTPSLARIKVFIVASDFVHDPQNKIVTTKGSIETEVSQAINSLAGDSGSSFTSAKPTSFLFLLKVVPPRSSNPTYQQVFQTLSDHCIDLLEKNLDASTRSGLSGGREFAQYISSSLTQWLTIELSKFISTDTDYPNIELTIKNDNWFPVTLTQLGVSINPQAPPIDSRFPTKIIPPGSYTHVLDTYDLPQDLKSTTIYLTPTQTPTPSTPVNPVKIDDIPASQLTILKATPLLFFGRQKVLVIKAEVSVRAEETTRKTRLDFSLIPIDPALPVTHKLLDQPLTVDLNNGSAVIFPTLYFDQPNFDYYNPKAYKLVVHKLDRGLVEEASRDLDLDHGIRYNFLWFFLGISFVGLVCVFFMPIDASAKTRVKGFREKLFITGIIIIALSALASFITVEKIHLRYTWFYAIAPAYLVAAWLFKFTVNRFEDRLKAYMRTEAEAPVEAFISKSISGAMALSFICFLVVLYLIATFAYQ